MLFVKTALCLSLSVLLLLFTAANAFAYKYKYETRLSVLDKYPYTSLKHGPVLDQKEFYNDLLNPEYNTQIGSIVNTAQNGDLDSAKLQWYRYFMERNIEDYLIDGMQKAESLTKDAVDWKQADRGLKRGYEKDGVEYFFEDEINWTFNPTYNNPDVPLNNEWVYQFNRHNWWPEMAKAALVTGDEAYEKELAYQMKSWILSQFPGIASTGAGFMDGRKAVVNYSTAYRNVEKEFKYSVKDADGNNLQGDTASWRSLEVGIRINNWIKTLYYFKNSKYFDADLCDMITRSLIDQATWLMFDNHYSELSNWATTESFGILYAAVFLPEMMPADRMKDAALTRLTDALKDQILPDGLLNELSPSYHMGVAEKYSILLKAGNDGKLKTKSFEALKNNLESQYNAILALTTPNAGLPTGNEVELEKTTGVSTLHEYFTEGAKLFPDRKDFLWLATGGKEGIKPQINSYRLRNSGFNTMRSGWEPDADYLFFSAGPTGSGSWHSFQNKLSIQLFSHGYPLLTTAGKDDYNYSALRWYSANTRGHNSALVDGYGQARDTKTEMSVLKKPAPFYYYDSPDGKVSYASASFNGPYGKAGYGTVLEKSDADVTHTRHVLYRNGSYVLIKDEFQANDDKEHQYELLYHTPIGWYEKHQPDVHTEAVPLEDGMYWKIGTSEATMKAISSELVQSEIVRGLNPENVELNKDLDGKGGENAMRGWLEAETSTPTEQYKLSGKNLTVFTAIAPMKKPDDFHLSLSADGQTVEIKFKNGDTQRVSIRDGEEGKPAIEMNGAGTSITFSAESNVTGKMDVHSGTLPR